MKKIIGWIFLLNACLAAWSGVCRAEELTLAAAIAESLQNNPDLQRTKDELAAASWKRLEAASPHLPHLTAGANQVVSEKYAYLDVYFGPGAVEFPSAMPSTTLDLSASWMVFDGLETWRNYQAADWACRAAELEAKRAEFLLTENTRLKYFQALAAQELLQVANQNIVTLEEHLAIANVSQRNGITTRFNVLRIEAQLEEARADKNLAEDNAGLARSALAQTMGREDDSRPLQGVLPVPDPGLTPAGLAPKVEDRDDVQAQLSRETAAEKSAQAAVDTWWPKAFVYASEEFYKFKAFDPAIVETPNFKDSYTIGARLTWSLFDGGATLARQQQAHWRLAQAQAATRSLRLKAANEFDLWKRRFLYNAGLYRARLRTEEKSKESVRLATLGLKAGSSTNSEVLDAELDLFRSRAGIVRAQMDAAEALINLENALGKSLGGNRN